MFGQPKNRQNAGSWSDKILGVVLYPYYLVAGFFSWLGMKFGTSWASRNLRNMLQGMPAVVGAIAVLLLGWSVYAHDRTELANHYLENAKISLRAGDFPMARTYIEKEIQIKGEDLESLFLLAIALEREGKGDHCLAIMQKLAPNTTKYGPAHRWMAGFIAQNYQNKPTTMSAVEKHLLRAHEYATNHPDDANELVVSNYLLAIFYCNNPNRFLEAEPYIRGCVDKWPNLKLVQGKILLMTGRKVEAYRVFDAVIATTSKAAEADLDKHGERVQWAEALVAKEDYATAIDVLRKGKITAPDDMRYPMWIAEVFAIRQAILAEKPGSNLGERLALIQAGLTA